MDRMAVRELSLEIESVLEENIYDWERYQYAQTDTAWRIANSLAFSLNGSDIEFLAGEIHSFDTGEIEIAAFTQQHLVYYRGNPDREGPSFKIFARRDISELVVHSAPVVLPLPSRRSLASSGSYGVTYGRSVSFTLPLGLRDINPAGLKEFFPSLMEDLLK